jgi:uncharacterized membrane protein
MDWILFPIISAFLLGIVTFTDKYLIEKYLKGGAIGSLVLFSSLVGLPIAFLIFIFHSEVMLIDPGTAALLMLNGAIYTGYLIPYFYALEKDDASVVGPLFLLSSVFTLILGFLILGEVLSNNQIVGSLLIFLGALGLTTELSRKKKVRFKREVFLLMALASFLIALNVVIFKFVALEVNFWTTSFWEYTGLFATSLLIFIFIGSYRKQFLSIIKMNRSTVLGLNMLNETTNIIAKIIFNYATLLAPIAVVSFVFDGFSPFFLLMIGLMLTVFLPKIIKENIERKYMVQKIAAIILLFLGTLVINN